MDLTEEELKLGIQAKKQNYRKLALAMIKEKELEDYYLRIDQEKALLVRILFSKYILLKCRPSASLFRMIENLL